jgi:uncharacterized protein YdaU (DUF1376 family)
MNYYQHHIGDFIRDTSRLSDQQCMAYLRMIWMYYETEQPLESDVDALAFKIGANASDVQQILKHFFFEHEGLWHNSRCDKEILAFRGRSEKAKKSANARWDNAKAMRTHSDCNASGTVQDANQEPVTSNQDKPSCQQPTATDACPHQKIIALYSEHLPELTQVRTWDGARATNMKARWRWVLADLKSKDKPHDEEAGLDFFKRMFAYVRQSDFLMGRSGRWMCDLPWLMKAENFAKVIEGNYENRDGA